MRLGGGGPTILRSSRLLHLKLSDTLPVCKVKLIKQSFSPHQVLAQLSHRHITMLNVTTQPLARYDLDYWSGSQKVFETAQVRDAGTERFIWLKA